MCAKQTGMSCTDTLFIVDSSTVSVLSRRLVLEKKAAGTTPGIHNFFKCARTVVRCGVSSYKMKIGLKMIVSDVVNGTRGIEVWNELTSTQPHDTLLLAWLTPTQRKCDACMANVNQRTIASRSQKSTSKRIVYGSVR